MDVKNSSIFLEELMSQDLTHQCGGKIPLKVYQLTVGQKEAMIYNHSVVQNGLDKKMVTTSPVKQPQLNIWENRYAR